MDDSASLNALTMEELGTIVHNEKYRSLVSELLPLYDDDESRERGPEVKVAPGSYRSRSRTRRDDVIDKDTSVEETPV